jgi:hypothetical protein
MGKNKIASAAIIAMLTLLTALEGVTYWNMIYPPPPPPDTNHPFLAAVYIFDVENITNQGDVANLSVRWTCWDDTALRIEYAPSNEVREIRVDQNDHFNLLLKPNTHAQVQFFAYSYIKKTNWTITVNIYRDGSKDLGPWSIVSS